MGRGYGYDVSEDHLGVVAGHLRAKEEAAAKEEADKLAALNDKAYQDLLKKRAQARVRSADRRQRERDRKVQARVKQEFEEAAGKLGTMFNTEQTETRLSAEGAGEASGMLPVIKEEEDPFNFNFLHNDLNDDEMVLDRRVKGIEAPPNSYVEESPLSAGVFTNGFASSSLRKNGKTMLSAYTTDDPFAIYGADCSSFYNGPASVNGYTSGDSGANGFTTASLNGYTSGDGGANDFTNTSVNGYTSGDGGANGFTDTSVNGHAGANGGVNRLTREDEMRARAYYEDSAFEEAFYFTGGARYNDKVSTGYL